MRVLQPRRHYNSMYYERRLPHWHVVGRPLFVTFRLNGSLPTSRVFPPGGLSSGRAFVAIDRILDRSRSGLLFLGRPEIARLVVQAIREGESRFQRYSVHAFVVMPNHVHLLATPRVTARRWLGPLKGFTAHEAHRILGRSRAPFWQDESYDRLIRDDREFERVRHYIEWNPVAAGIVATPQEFPWSSATPGGSPAAAGNGCPTSG